MISSLMKRAGRACGRSFFSAPACPPIPKRYRNTSVTGWPRRTIDFYRPRPPTATPSPMKTGWHLSADATEKLDEATEARLKQLKSWLAKSLRRIRLPELLIEVDNELGFTHHFMAHPQRQDSSPEDVCAVLAAVMAHGCNIGSYTMAQLIPDVTYEQLKRIGDWQLTEESQRRALADLVNAIAGLDTALYWGEGKTSASDGQRFSLPRRVLQQTYSTRFSDFALEFYTFVADNYAPFYSQPIECTDRDAAFVLDGLLYNENDLPLEEHYTDTHGYTEINFAAFAMLGRRFCPRIRGVQHQRIYRIDPAREYGPLKSLVGRADRTIDTGVIAEQWDRMGQLYASLQSGHVTASVALKTPSGVQRQESLLPRQSRPRSRPQDRVHPAVPLRAGSGGDASAVGYSRWSSSMRWRATSFTVGVAGSMPANCGNR